MNVVMSTMFSNHIWKKIPNEINYEHGLFKKPVFCLDCQVM